MKHNKWNRQSRIGVGALGALLVGWASIAFGVWLNTLAINHLSPPLSLFPPKEYIAGFGALWLAAFVPIGFAMGFICALCWHDIKPSERHYGWATGLSIVFFLPLAIIGVGGFWLLLFAFPLFLCALHYGLTSRARLPYFLGLTNDYERNENEI